MKDRIRKIIELQHMTQQEFAECIKVAPATLSSIFTGRTAPSLKIVEAIKNRFPDISTDWLMFGRGAMTDYHAAEEASAAGVSGGIGNMAGSSVGRNAEAVSTSVSHQPSASGAVCSQDATASVRDNVQTVPSLDVPEREIVSVSAITNPCCEVKKCDKRERHIVEIRIFYDDQTWETFVPKGR